ncbi:MAG TPA: radical SAM protein [Candidatus Cloacimonadota bacterium]|nr:radical SAM protein [Candidatus Cloacimonadota bacterium]
MGKFNFLSGNLTNSIHKELSLMTGKVMSKPLQISIQPNERCNAKCRMCDCWKEKNDYLSSEEIIATLKKLKQWIKSDIFVQIAGGEPLIFKGIFDIFSFCSQNGIICKISTNGIALTESNCDKIIASKLPYLSVSIDSHLPEIHDKFRGVEKTLEKAVNGIKYLSEHGNLTLGISSILMKDNVSTFDKSVDFFLDLPIHRLLIQPIRLWTEQLPIERWKEYEYWINDLPALEKFITFLLAKKKEDNRIMNTEQDIRDWYRYFQSPAAMRNDHTKKCTIGYDRLSVTYRGDVFLGCTSFGSVGNIKTDDIRQIWYSAKAEEIRKKMLKCQLPCTSNCYKDLSLKEKIKKARLLIKSGLFDKK